MASKPKIQTLKPRIGLLNTSRVKTMGTGARAKGDGATARGYGYKWQKARERFLRTHPLCCYCQREGRIAPADVVDHITPHRGDMVLFWNEANWQPLCKRCHDTTKAREERSGGVESLWPLAG